MKASYNFFKHADRDHEGQLERFHSGINTYLLFACCRDFMSVFGALPSVLHVYFCWFLAVHPNIMKDDFPKKVEMLALFDDLSTKSEDGQRQLGKELLRTYLAQHREPFPLNGW